MFYFEFVVLHKTYPPICCGLYSVYKSQNMNTAALSIIGAQVRITPFLPFRSLQVFVLATTLKFTQLYIGVGAYVAVNSGIYVDK